MIVKLDDDVVAGYAAHAQAAKIPVEKLIERQLVRFQDFPVTQRLVVLTKEPLHEIETLLGGPQLRTPDQVLERVRNWAGIHLGMIRLPLTASQLEEIATRAEKQGKTPEAVVQDLVDQLLPMLFHDTVGVR